MLSAVLFNAFEQTAGRKRINRPVRQADSIFGVRRVIGFIIGCSIPYFGLVLFYYVRFLLREMYLCCVASMREIFVLLQRAFLLL